MRKSRDNIRMRAARKLSEGLKEALGYFWFESIGAEDDDSGFEEMSFTEPEEIQGAIDTAISSLVSEKLIALTEDEAPSLSEVMSALFGEEHELTKRGEYFEELINGYEGEVSVEGLREAQAVLKEIVDGLTALSTPTTN